MVPPRFSLVGYRMIYYIDILFLANYRKFENPSVREKTRLGTVRHAAELNGRGCFQIRVYAVCIHMSNYWTERMLCVG